MRSLIGWGLVLLLTVFLVYELSLMFAGEKEFSRDQLHEVLANPGSVKNIWIRGQTLYGELASPEYANRYGATKFKVTLNEREVSDTIVKLTDNAQLRKVFYDNEKEHRSYIADDSLAWQMLLSTLPWLLLLLPIWYFVSRQMRAASGPGGVLSFGRSRARLAKKERVKVTFDDVAGIEEAKDEVKEIVEFLKNPSKFQRLGGRIPRGVMLVGPPGTGKTLLAKAIAGEADVPFFSISGSDFVEMFVGVGASRVRDLFRMAKESSPCIIFLDEIDAVGRKRGGMGYSGGHDEREQTLNAILVEMDGFETNEQVIVIGSTNRPDVLDPALRRPGRFDREIMVSLPDVREREEILKVHARKVKMDPGVDFSQLARGTPGFSGADLAAIVNEAAIRATLLNKQAVEQDDLEESRDKVRWGRAKRSRAMDELERRNTAYHEAGHALVAILLAPDVEPLHKVSIIPRGMMLGATMFLPEKDTYNKYRRQLYGEIKVAFGGRIAEEMFLGDISAGASSDIRQATYLARRMVCDWGMSDKLGPIRYAPPEESNPWGGDLMGPREHSDATARDIDEEIQSIINRCYDEAKHLLETNRDGIQRVAEALLKYEVLNADEVRLVIEGLPIARNHVVPGPAPSAPSGNPGDPKTDTAQS
jgi:cell division protease FtsH